MRARRQFQPMLNSMPSRIAPSTGVLLAPLVQTVALPQDTDPPEGGGSGPIIIAPVSNPPTLPC
jgi:hypothetical protein